MANPAKLACQIEEGLMSEARRDHVVEGKLHVRNMMAGSLGVSSLVRLLNNGDGGNSETSQSLLGPFWRLNSPRVAERRDDSAVRHPW